MSELHNATLSFDRTKEIKFIRRSLTMRARFGRFAVVGALMGVSAMGGAQWQRKREMQVLPRSSLPMCVDAEEGRRLSSMPDALVDKLKGIVGPGNVVEGKASAVKPYTKGMRIGEGHAGAVVKPGSVREALEVVQACVDAGVVILPQGANTGLTGGSVPRDSVGRPFVVINMRRMSNIVPLEGHSHVLAFAGAGIFNLSRVCDFLGRESHSVLGSFFLNPSVAAGIAFGSGGTQLRKGPVYTERVLYIRVNKDGKAELVDNLGLQCANQQDLIERLESGDQHELRLDPRSKGATHDEKYAHHLCRLDSSDVSRFNADTRGGEPLRSEGKVLILASIHSTFPKPKKSQLVWVSCRDFADAHALRTLCLENAHDMPSTLEYMDRDCFDVVDRAGRILCFTIRHLGIGPKLQSLWAFKQKVESVPFLDRLPDWAMYWANPLVPRALPTKLMECGKHFDHHLIIQVDDYGDGGYQRLLAKLQTFQERNPAASVHFLDASDAGMVKNFRFAAAPAFRTFCVGKGWSGISLDYALPLNYKALPDFGNATKYAKRMRYSHFGCAVVHEDVAYPPADLAPSRVEDEKHRLKHIVELLGGALPAEHGHGVEYKAPEAALRRLRSMDPTNVFNPGVGCDSERPFYNEEDKK